MIPHHGNIKDKKFGPEYFKKFTLVSAACSICQARPHAQPSQVINALDNVPARQHVNRMCMTVGIPLIDSGTEGYEGRVEQFHKGHSSCYDCTPKATRKTYPICTIRSTPDKPVHCIVWAKELHKLLVGPAQQSMLFEAEGGQGGGASSSQGGAAAAADDQKGGSEAAYMQAVARPASFEEHVLDAYAKGVFHAMFHAEIEKKLSMRLEAYKVAGRVPVPLSFETASQAAAAAPADFVAELPEQRVLSVAESATLFVHAIKEYFTVSMAFHTAGHLQHPWTFAGWCAEKPLGQSGV